MSEPDVLEAHRIARTGLADRLVKLHDLADLAGERRLAEQIKAEERRCRRGEFVVAIVGEFSTGKSTLINALLGSEELPTDATECTQVLTRLRLASAEQAAGTFVRLRTGVERTVDLAVLRDLLRTADATLDGEDVSEGEFRLNDLAWLKQGVTVVDTPGISGGVRSEEATLEFLPTADALLFVTRADRFLRASEVSFLNDHVPDSIRDRIMLIINAADRLGSEQDRKDVLARVTSELGDSVAPERVHFVSARSARNAHRDKNAEALAQSGIPVLKDAVASFLAEERGASALQHHARILRHLSDELEQALRVRLADLELDDDLRQQRMERVGKLIEMARADGTKLQALTESQMRRALTRSLGAVVEEEGSQLRGDLNLLNRRDTDVSRSSVGGIVRNAGRRAMARLQATAQTSANGVHKTIAKDLMDLFDRLDEDLGVKNVVGLQDVDFDTLVQLRTVQEQVAVGEHDTSGSAETLGAEDVDARMKAGAVGGTIGFMVGGPPGAFIGGILGLAFGGKEENSISQRVMKTLRRDQADVGAIERGFQRQLQAASENVTDALVRGTTGDVTRIVRSKVTELEERLDRLQAERSGGDGIEHSSLEARLRELQDLRPAALPS